MASYELLAPAGNLEALIGAINAGADAVYLGGSKFGARAYADNFSEEELIQGIRYAHLYGRKVYLTMNTLVKSKELEEVYEYLHPYYVAGIDGVIIQDIGLLEYLKKSFPGLELHISTQMTVTGSDGAKYLKELGASRVVPAREISLEEIKTIKQESGMEVEVFVHGAMCYCYSGQCLFSSILGGRSGNRGRCAQPCRLSYQIKSGKQESKECFPLSLKDMCTLESIGELMDAGVDSFKIEGRMKKPEYAAGVTSIYRKYMDRKLENPEASLKIEPKDLEMLSKLYIRSEKQDGYLFKHNGRDMITLDSPAYSGSDDVLLQNIRDKYLTPKTLPVHIYANFLVGQKAEITIICQDLTVTCYGDVVEKASKMPITEESIEKQVLKLGETIFHAKECLVTTDGESFYSLKLINELRREAVKELEDKLLSMNGFTNRKEVSKKEIVSVRPDIGKLVDGYRILVSSREQLEALVESKPLLLDLNVNSIYVESNLWRKDKEFIRRTQKNLDEITFYVALPYILRANNKSSITKLIKELKEYKEIGLLARNLEEIALLKELEFTGKIWNDVNLYVWNEESLSFWKERVEGVTAPYELNSKETENLFHEKSFEKIIYGYIPMMITANCIKKTNNECQKNMDNKVSLVDRYHKEFPVLCNCLDCYNVILNSIPLSLHGKNLKRYEEAIKRLQFTIESKNEVKNILNFFVNEKKEKGIQPPYKEYTNGHEKRGVE